MELKQQLAGRTPPGRATVAAVGTFDGVHLGHRQLLAKVREEAERRGLASVVITFRQPPRALIRPDAPITYLCGLDDRLQYLNELGLDAVAPIDFNDSIRMLAAEQFIQSLKEAIGLRVLVLGPGARLGHDQANIADLEPMTASNGIDVVAADAALVDGVAISSSAIRAALNEGRVSDAARMLGRSYSLAGEVVPGDRRGRELGFPTANLAPHADTAVPLDGIYATRVHFDGANHEAATSIGSRPTFGGGRRAVEAFLLDFDGDLYGKRIKIEFVRRLRDEIAFDGAESLIEQMERDVAETRAVLSGS